MQPHHELVSHLQCIHVDHLLADVVITRLGRCLGAQRRQTCPVLRFVDLTSREPFRQNLFRGIAGRRHIVGVCIPWPR